MNKFIIVTGYESGRKFRVNIDHIRTYVISKNKNYTSIQSIMSVDNIDVSETPEQIDIMIKCCNYSPNKESTI